jgi:hypothetical protein
MTRNPWHQCRKAQRALTFRYAALWYGWFDGPRLFDPDRRRWATSRRWRK